MRDEGLSRSLFDVKSDIQPTGSIDLVGVIELGRFNPPCDL